LSFRYLVGESDSGTEVAIVSIAMRIAIPIWNDRVSPVFDVARSVRVVDINDGVATCETHHKLENEARASKLVKLGVDLLICAAISTPLEAALWVSGIEVIPDTCGTVDEIVEALVSGDVELARFRSPGNTRSHRSVSKISSHHPSRHRISR
jgi:predicted Fe-Mo cluster-binding NifX family protein